MRRSGESGSGAFMVVRSGHMSQADNGEYRPEDTGPGGLLDPGSVRLLFRRHWRLISCVFAGFVLVGVAVVSVLPPRYTATAVLLVDPRQQRVVQSEAVLPGIGNDSAAVESQIEVIQSTTLARRVIEELHLAESPDFEPTGLGQALARLKTWIGGARREDPEGAARRLLARFADGLRVQRRGQTYVLEVGYVARDPDRAAAIANAVANAYLRQQVTLKRDATQEASGWLDGRLDDLRRQADAADRAVADYKAAHGLVDTGDRGGQRQTLVEQQLADLNAQLVQARVKVEDVQSRYDQVKRASADSVGNGGLPEALQSPVILALRTQLAATARNVAEMTQVYGPRHPAIRTGQAELGELHRQVAAELARIAAGLQNELASAKARVAALGTSLKALKSQSADTDQDNVKLHELQREADATRTVLQQFLLRYRETSEQQTLQVPDARILSPAAAPLVPSSPNVPVLLGLFTIIGLALGLAAGVLADRLSRSVRSAREAEKLLALPVLALLPEVNASDLPPLAGRRGRPADRERIDRLAVDRPLSRFGEAIRGLAIRLRPPHADRCTVMLVVSAIAGEGSSTVAANIARVMARGGASTLLVDADVRRRAEATSLPGLHEALRDGANPLSLLRREPDSGLVILPGGQIDDPGGASQLLTSRAMDQALATLRPKFDTIVVDGAPILSSVDSRALLDLADAALLVVAWDETRRDSLEAAVDSLGANADKVLGIALNKVGLDAGQEELAQTAAA